MLESRFIGTDRRRRTRRRLKERTPKNIFRRSRSKSTIAPENLKTDCLIVANSSAIDVASLSSPAKSIVCTSPTGRPLMKRAGVARSLPFIAMIVSWLSIQRVEMSCRLIGLSFGLHTCLHHLHQQRIPAIAGDEPRRRWAHFSANRQIAAARRIGVFYKYDRLST